MQHKTIFKEFTASILSVTAIALCAALWVHPGLASTASQADIVWRGCGITKKAFMAEAAEAYRQQTGINISLSGGGATLGIRTAAAGKADSGFHRGGIPGKCRNDTDSSRRFLTGLESTAVPGADISRNEAPAAQRIIAEIPLVQSGLRELNRARKAPIYRT